MIGNPTAVLQSLALKIVNFFLSPLELINIAIDWLLGFEIIKDFLNIVAFVLPWNNIMPLISLVISFFIFRIVISIIKTIWELLPLV